jgi:hypothetical protein
MSEIKMSDFDSEIKKLKDHFESLFQGKGKTKNQYDLIKTQLLTVINFIPTPTKSLTSS